MSKVIDHYERENQKTEEARVARLKAGKSLIID